jgi:hypothetical protein
MVRQDGSLVADDEHEDGTLISGIDDGEQPATFVPEWLDVLDDVTDDETRTGAMLTRKRHHRLGQIRMRGSPTDRGGRRESPTLVCDRLHR